MDKRVEDSAGDTVVQGEDVPDVVVVKQDNQLAQGVLESSLVTKTNKDSKLSNAKSNQTID